MIVKIWKKNIKEILVPVWGLNWDDWKFSKIKEKSMLSLKCSAIKLAKVFLLIAFPHPKNSIITVSIVTSNVFLLDDIIFFLSNSFRFNIFETSLSKCCRWVETLNSNCPLSNLRQGMAKLWQGDHTRAIWKLM